MKKRLYIIIIASTLIIAFILATFFIIKSNRTKEDISNENNTEETINQEVSEEGNEVDSNNTIVIDLGEGNNVENEIEEQESTSEEDEKSPAELTQEIYAINGPIGRIQIPSTGVDLTILSNVTVDNMEKSPCFLYTTGGINEVGVTLIVGHNKRNGTLFSDNANIEEGDKIYITDLEDNTLTYSVYSKIITTDSDTSFLKDDVDTPELVLSSCTDDETQRIIILARAE